MTGFDLRQIYNTEFDKGLLFSYNVKCISTLIY